MKSNAGFLKLRLVGLAIGTSLLTGCGTGVFEPVVGVCPPVMEHSREFQARAAEEVTLLPNGSAVVEMMGDYAVLRDQANAC